MKLAFSTNAYRNFSIEDSILSIKNAGYSALEIMCDIPHAYPPLPDEKIESIKTNLEKNQMSISNLNGFMLCAIENFHHPSWIEPSSDYRRKRIEHTRNCIILAEKLGAASVSTEPGGPRTGNSERYDLDLFENGINELIPTLEETKIKLLIEPEPNLLIENSNQFLNFIKRFSSDFIGLNFDIGHFYCVGEDPAKLILKLKDYISHIHLEDIASNRVHNHLIPGHGVINFEEIFDNLEKINYDGFVTIELYPYLENPQHAALKSLQNLKSIIQDA